MAKSERLQMKRIAEKEGFFTATTAVILFPEETKYSMVSLSSIKEINPKVGDFVHVKEQGKTHKAKLVKTGSESACKKKVAKLERALSACDESDQDEVEDDEFENSQSDKDVIPSKRKKYEETQKQKGTTSTDCNWKEKIESEKAEFEKLMNLRKEQSSPEPYDIMDNESVNSDQSIEVESDKFTLKLLHTKVDKLFSCVESMSEKVDKLLTAKTSKPHHISTNPQTPQQFRRMESRPNTPSSSKDSESVAEVSFNAESEENAHDLVFDGIDLLSLPASPKNPQKYALKVLSTLFTDEELMKGMVAPVNKKGIKTELDPKRINILKECVMRKFGEKTLTKMWSTIRTSCNQKGCDLLKKKITSENNV